MFDDSDQISSSKNDENITTTTLAFTEDFTKNNHSNNNRDRNLDEILDENENIIIIILSIAIILQILILIIILLWHFYFKKNKKKLNKKQTNNKQTRQNDENRLQLLLSSLFFSRKLNKKADINNEKSTFTFGTEPTTTATTKTTKTKGEKNVKKHRLSSTAATLTITIDDDDKNNDNNMKIKNRIKQNMNNVDDLNSLSETIRERSEKSISTMKKNQKIASSPPKTPIKSPVNSPKKSPIKSPNKIRSKTITPKSKMRKSPRTSPKSLKHTISIDKNKQKYELSERSPKQLQLLSKQTKTATTLSDYFSGKKGMEIDSSSPRKTIDNDRHQSRTKTITMDDIKAKQQRRERQIIKVIKLLAKNSEDLRQKLKERNFRVEKNLVNTNTDNINNNQDEFYIDNDFDDTKTHTTTMETERNLTRSLEPTDPEMIRDLLDNLDRHRQRKLRKKQ